MGETEGVEVELKLPHEHTGGYDLSGLPGVVAEYKICVGEYMAPATAIKGAIASVDDSTFTTLLDGVWEGCHASYGTQST